MTKYIDAEQKITVQVYDEEHEEWTIKETTIECALDFWSNEGCPPAADVVPRWIPITERLPAYGEDVILSMSGDYGIGYLVPTHDKRGYEWYHSGWFYDLDEVDAWMPLPESYREGDAE